MQLQIQYNKKRKRRSYFNPIFTETSLYRGLWKIGAIDVNVGHPFKIWINCSLGFPYYCLHGSSGCLGCHVRPKLNSSLDEFKGKNNHDWKNTKTTLSEDFWTTSNCNMENTALQSCGSISSTSTLTQVYDAHGAGCSSTPSEFVNHGLILWNQNRQKWAWDKKPESRAQQLREPKLSWNATYDSLLSNNKPFDKPVPLGEMVDFLVAVWEQEGMYD